MNGKIEKKYIDKIRLFFKNESSSGIILLVFTIIAIIIANSNFLKLYENILNTYITIGYEKYSISMTILHWINDGLMTLFFLVVGMEIKSEMSFGELKSIKNSILPICAAIGGMIVPAIIYASINYKEPTVHGWGIPMATDIAFALGVLSLVGRNVPKGITIFLTALAIVDDLGAIIVIAVFYNNNISVSALFMGAIVFLLLIISNRLKIKNSFLYIILGIILWLCILKSGIHPTIAGVLLGMSLPIGANADEFESSILYRFNKNISPISNFFIMPLFALANAGIVINLSDFSSNIFSKVSIGIIFGLFFGKQIGIFGTSYLLIKFKFANMPIGANKYQLYGASVVGGIGFTMSIFVSSLSFNDESTLSLAKMCIMIASVLVTLYSMLIFKIISLKINNDKDVIYDSSNI